jgi:farnesyl-diphosphate farnesyltransferase
MEMLKGVSRSFVLTIRALPGDLRRPVGIAYLLARASDTIADTASAPVAARIECLRAFAAHPGAEIRGLRDIKPDNVAEQHLLENLGPVSRGLDQLGSGDREEIVSLLQKITRGQELDLVRFSDPGKISALETAAELDEYTYLVAGCVGEFWTRICSGKLPRYGYIDSGELLRLGRAFGQGLQLVNILRDFPADVENGRCFLPMDELREAGVSDAGELRRDLRPAQPVFDAWRQKALLFLDEGRQYIEGIRPRRIRFACLLPWALGVRTLKLIGEKSPLERGERVKVDRKEVRRIMQRALWAALSNGAISSWARTIG